MKAAWNEGLQTIFTGLLGVWYVGSGLGMRELWRDRNRQAVVVVFAFISYFCLLSAGPEANTRFRVPIMPFVAVLSGLGLARLAARRHASR